MSMFTAAVTLYANKFGEPPTVVGLSEAAQRKATEVLIKAVQNNDPFLNDDDFYREIGVDPPEDDVPI